jgi:hypothetical protein
MWRISIHSDFDSLGGPLSPCGSHWLRLEPFTQIRSRTLCWNIELTVQLKVSELNRVDANDLF